MQIIVFFKIDHLKPLERYSLPPRRTIANAGTEQLRQQFSDEGLIFGAVNHTSCCVSISGPENKIKNVIAFMDEHPEIGDYEIDDPKAVRGARGM